MYKKGKADKSHDSTLCQRHRDEISRESLKYEANRGLCPLVQNFYDNVIGTKTSPVRLRESRMIFVSIV